MLKWDWIFLIEADTILVDGACLTSAMNLAFGVLIGEDHNALGKFIETNISEIKNDSHLTTQLPFTVYERHSTWKW